jgi:aryl-alcohol dehydrogenase-like predicted oxidoreductase
VHYARRGTDARNREEEREMNKYCDFAGIGLIPWGPLNAGRLARPLAQDTTRSESTKGTPWAQKTPEWDGEIVDRVEKLAKEKGWKMSQVALAWVNEKVTAPIVGFSSVSSTHRERGLRC